MLHGRTPTQNGTLSPNERGRRPGSQAATPATSRGEEHGIVPPLQPDPSTDCVGFESGQHAPLPACGEGRGAAEEERTTGELASVVLEPRVHHTAALRRPKAPVHPGQACGWLSGSGRR